MSHYRVVEYRLTHTCPANPTTAHPWATRRKVVEVVDRGPCLTPVPVDWTDPSTGTLPCHRTRPYERQCRNCRTTVEVVSVITQYTGHISRAASEQAA